MFGNGELLALDLLPFFDAVQKADDEILRLAARRASKCGSAGAGAGSKVPPAAAAVVLAE
jgi:hypothetical protein